MLQATTGMNSLVVKKIGIKVETTGLVFEVAGNSYIDYRYCG